MKLPAVLIGLSCVFSSCNKVPDECKFEGPHLLELPVTIKASSVTYSVGDSIYINSSFTANLYDRKTIQDYEAKSFRFSPLTYGYDLLDSNLNTSHHLDEYFDLVIDKKYEYGLFKFSDGNTVLKGEYLWENNRYNIEYVLVPKKPGLFMIKHGSALLKTDHDQKFEGQCPSKGIEFATVVNGDTSNNNIHLLLESPNEHWNTWELQKPQERFHNQGGYAFRVVE